MAYADDVKRILGTMNDEADQVAALAGMTREQVEAVGGTSAKSATISVCLTAEEADLVRRAAAAIGMTVSVFVRYAVLEAAHAEVLRPYGDGVEVSPAVPEDDDDPMGFSVPDELVPLFTAEDGKFTPDLWWWSFDTFFIGFIRVAAKKLREDGHGHPGNMTETEWVDYLLQIENDLAAYGVMSGWKKDDETYLAAQRAVYRFADLLGAWWD